MFKQKNCQATHSTTRNVAKKIFEGMGKLSSLQFTFNSRKYYNKAQSFY